MIKANELRIGNWVEIATKTVSEFRRLVEIKSSSVVVDGKSTGDSYKSLRPIPISCEILQMIGFVKEDLGDDPPYEWWVHKDHEQIKIWDFNGEEWMSEIHDQLGLPGHTVDNLHQLQNLYFALTGTELTINF